MNNELEAGVLQHKPICVGTGLIALDIVISSNSQTSPRLSAGGSCGNVLVILSYLGWSTFPIAKLKDDKAAAELLSDMQRWKVNTTLIGKDTSGSTPVIVERISTTKNGTPRHTFALACPNCGAWFPKYRAISARDAAEISNYMPNPQVFFFDRVARSSIELARESKRRGALVMFEPSAVKDEKLFLLIAA